MNARLIALRSLRHYRRTNVAVIAGVACAVAVLAGALLVGESVRASLRAIAGARLGNADIVVTSETFFREELAQALRTSTSHAAPVILLNGAVTHEPSGRRASNVAVYGVDDRFFAFHGASAPAFSPRGARVSAALASELGLSDGESLVVRIARPTDIPLESLHGQRDDTGSAVRVTADGALDAEGMGEFSVSPSQGAHHAVFLPLARLQRELEVEARVNALLLEIEPGSDFPVQDAVRQAATPEDVGLHVRVLDEGTANARVAVESDAGLIPPALVEDIRRAAASAGLVTMPVLTYLANDMTSGGRVVPYSLIAAIDASALEGEDRERFAALAGGGDAMVLNEWAARDLGVSVGDPIEIAYYRWLDSGRLATETATFRVAGVTPIEGLAADRRLSPEYPGISDTNSLSDWDPPFPVDLSRVRPIDEDYWDAHRTTPKAFIAIEAGQELWQSRWGAMTSLRVGGPGTAGDRARALTAAMRETIDPLEGGLHVVDVRAESAQASQGSADFGQYFLGFSFFLVVSALLLAALFFRLGVEQRLREIGLLSAVGFTRAGIRRIFLLEGLTLAVVGSLAGVAGAIGYAAFVLYGLRTWWQGAVNTTAIELHVAPMPLVAGALAGVVTAWLCIVLSIRGLRALSPRSLLSGQSVDAHAGGGGSHRRVWTIAIGAGAAALALVALGAAGIIPDAGAFFGAGMLLLVALLALFNLMLRRRAGAALQGRGQGALARLGFRNASWRPGRSVLSAALVAAAVFLIVSVDAFRKGGDEDLRPEGGAGGFALVGESAVPLVHDLNTPEGREDAGLLVDEALASTLTFHQLRLRPGDDTSCVNLYKPTRPRIVGVSDPFIDAGRFTFAASLAETDEQRANPWTLLRQEPGSPAYPAIADATSLQYVLHASVGDEIVIDEDTARPRRLLIVGSLRDSALQGEIIVGDASFKRMFPDEPGYRMLLVEVEGDHAPGAASEARLRDVAGELESGLDQAGLDVQLTNDRLAAYHRVENTYLTTFQSLGALGLLLGTFGLATVLARNVLERRRELALMRAVGFDRGAVSATVLAEHLALLVAGMLAGALTAAVAIVPAIADRGFGGGWSLPAWLAGIFIAGALVTMAASRAALRRPLLGELRSE